MTNDDFDKDLEDDYDIETVDDDARYVILSNPDNIIIVAIENLEEALDTLTALGLNPDSYNIKPVSDPYVCIGLTATVEAD